MLNFVSLQLYCYYYQIMIITSILLFLVKLNWCGTYDVTMPRKKYLFILAVLVLFLIPSASAASIVPPPLPHTLTIVKPGHTAAVGRVEVKAYLGFWIPIKPIRPLPLPLNRNYSQQRSPIVYPAVVGRIYLDNKLVKTTPFRPVHLFKPEPFKSQENQGFYIIPYTYVLDTVINVRTAGRHTLMIKAIEYGKVIAKNSVTFSAYVPRVVLTFVSPHENQVITNTTVKVVVLASAKNAVNFAENPADFAKVYLDGRFVIKVPFKPDLKPGTVYIPEYNTKIAKATIEVFPGQHTITVVAVNTNNVPVSQASVSIKVLPVWPPIRPIPVKTPNVS